MPKVCSVEGCDKPQHSRGLCSRHRMRLLRNGDPISGRNNDGAPERAIVAAVNSDTDDCILWPHGRTTGGYGTFVSVNGGTTAHREVTVRVHGEPPTLDHQSAHSCGNRACINPRHLRWATATENAADRKPQGTHLEGDKCSWSKIPESALPIIRTSDPSQEKELAMKYNASWKTIRLIRGGWNRPPKVIAGTTVTVVK